MAQLELFQRRVVRISRGLKHMGLREKAKELQVLAKQKNKLKRVKITDKIVKKGQKNESR